MLRLLVCCVFVVCSVVLCHPFEQLRTSNDIEDFRPMENPGLIEGDILPSSNLYSAVSSDQYKWPGGKVYYTFDKSVDKSLQSTIIKAMEEIHSKTCIRYENCGSSCRGDYVLIKKANGCWANVGRVGGGSKQELSLGSGCGYHGTAIHELLHLLGFYHEHTRSDRDDYININMANINNKYHSEFRKLQPSQNRLLTGFDYDSVMLYGSNSFSSSPGKYSMTRKNGQILREVHEKTGLSNNDIQRIKKLYC